jgi:hypothetical protein
MPEPLAPPARFLHDLSTVSCFALLAVPLYFVLNDYWQSLLRLGGLYVALGMFCMRLGHYIRRVMRREPAEIPPWEAPLLATQAPLLLESHVQATEAMQNVYSDPHYLQEVLKPRLQQLLAYRVWGLPSAPAEALAAAAVTSVDPAVVQFLQRREPSGLWARYTKRQRRVQDVLATLQRFETL